jgi:hypothetical protein
MFRYERRFYGSSAGTSKSFLEASTEAPVNRNILACAILLARI